MYERVCQNTWYTPTLISPRWKCDYWLLDKCLRSFLRKFTKKGGGGRRLEGFQKQFEQLKEAYRYQTKPRVKHWPVTVRLGSIWQRRHVVTSPCRLHFLLPFPMFPLSFPSNHGEYLENNLRHSKCNLPLVTARVSLLASLPLSLFSFFTFFFLPFSLCLHLVSITALTVHLWCFLGEIHALYCFGELHVG